MSALSAAVLAGGRSVRMGRDKASLSLGGRALVEVVADRLREVTDEVLVVGKVAVRVDGTRAVADEVEAQTPLAGVCAALQAARSPLVFVCACDMPLISPEVVRLLAEQVGDAAAAVPVRDGRLEPLHAVWSTRAAGAVEASLAAGELAVHRVLETLDVRRVTDWNLVDPQGRTFTNLNTPEEYASHVSSWGSGGG